MNNDLDKQLRDLLDASSPADAGFDLNKEKVWRTIDSKQKTKVVPFRKWISHAAAVAAGILLCLPFLFRTGKETVRTVTVTKMAPPEKIFDTVLVLQQPEPAANHQLAYRPQNKNQDKAESIAAQTIQPVSSRIDNDTPAAGSEPVIAQTTMPVRKMQVLHIADIENENALPKARPREGYALFNKINFSSRPDDASETVSMIVSSQFFQPKN